MSSAFEPRRIIIGTIAATLSAACVTPLKTYAQSQTIQPVGSLEQNLKSRSSDQESTLTVCNNSLSFLKTYWVNYDGDWEFFTYVPPGRQWLVDTFVSHPWHIVDATSGAVLRTVVSRGGDQVVTIEPWDVDLEGLETGEKPSLQQIQERRPVGRFPDDGFDGVGGSEEEYVEAQITEIDLDGTGGVVYLSPADVAARLLSGSLQERRSLGSTLQRHAEGVPIFVGPVEAGQLLQAAGQETRRPQTSTTWMRTIEAADAHVDRVLITRLVNHTFYARILLRLPSGMQRSVDARPSDSLALAVATRSPIYMAKSILSNPNRQSPPPGFAPFPPSPLGELDFEFDEILDVPGGEI